MDSPNLALEDRGIGAVFTPEKWAGWLIQQCHVLERWRLGQTICDPTSGEGAFIHALMEAARQADFKVTGSGLSRLFVIEKNSRSLAAFQREFKRRWGRAFPSENIFHADVITENPARTFDFLLGNPPWVNFTDLPAEDKECLKSYFVESGLAGDRRGLILGGARIDLAALVIHTVLLRNLRPGGEAAFFVPLSLFLNDGAHAGFRSYRLGSGRFRLDELWHFSETKVFPEVLARYGAAHFTRDASPCFPISYHLESHGGWVRKLAAPLGALEAPLSVVDSAQVHGDLAEGSSVKLRTGQTPRQGMNTGGANDIFMFERPYPGLEPFTYPLITGANFHEETKSPRKFVLLPHDPISGQPLREDELRRHPELLAYLSSHRARLEKRKGTMLRTWIERGRWWACLGVGPYSFTSHKLVWEAYGKRQFNPTVFSQFAGRPWQGNQSLQAYIPCVDLSEAELLRAQLLNSRIQQYLESMKMEGTCNWAQPGRIKRFLAFHDESAGQVALL